MHSSCSAWFVSGLQRKLQLAGKRNKCVASIQMRIIPVAAEGHNVKGIQLDIERIGIAQQNC